MDVELRDAGHSKNPGTTADLTTAAIFVMLLGGAWRVTTIDSLRERIFECFHPVQHDHQACAPAGRLSRDVSVQAA
jgi:hypothetical protein